jgi:hypothetical protein
MLSETACPDNSGKSRLSAAKAGFAGKKIIIYLTIGSLLNLVGCYYQQQMTPEEYNFNENLPIEIIKKDSTVYVSNPYEYQLRGDTLFTLQQQTLDNNMKQSIMFGVPLNEIQSIKAERMDAGDTILLISAITAGILVIAGIIYLAGLDYSYGPILSK